MKLYLNSGTDDINVLDNNYFDVYSNSVAVSDVDQESGCTYSTKGVKTFSISFSTCDFERSEPIPYQVFLSSGSSVNVRLNFTKNHHGYSLICWTSSSFVSVDLPRSLLNKNKFGRLADLETVGLMVIHRICGITFNNRSIDEDIIKTMKTMRVYNAKRKN